MNEKEVFQVYVRRPAMMTASYLIRATCKEDAEEQMLELCYSWKNDISWNLDEFTGKAKIISIVKE
jgi:hypothetical protein